MPRRPSQPDHSNHARYVRVASCHAADRQGNRGSELIAVITFSQGRKLLEPFGLSVLQVRVLINDLIQLLKSHVNIQDDRAILGDEPCLRGPATPPTSIPSQSPDGKRNPIKPSILPATPRGQIGPIEARLWSEMLKNVRNHDDFLRFINAAAPAKDSKQLSQPRRSSITRRSKKKRCL
jgi:hypothetical protein